MVRCNRTAGRGEVQRNRKHDQALPRTLHVLGGLPHIYTTGQVLATISAASTQRRASRSIRREVQSLQYHAYRIREYLDLIVINLPSVAKSTFEATATVRVDQIFTENTAPCRVIRIVSSRISVGSTVGVTSDLRNFRQINPAACCHSLPLMERRLTLGALDYCNPNGIEWYQKRKIL